MLIKNPKSYTLPLSLSFLHHQAKLSTCTISLSRSVSMSGSGRELFFSDAGDADDYSWLRDDRDPLSLFMSFDDAYFCEALGSQSSSFAELAADVAAPSSPAPSRNFQPASSSSLEVEKESGENPQEGKAAAGEAAANLDNNDDDDKPKKVVL